MFKLKTTKSYIIFFVILNLVTIVLFSILLTRINGRNNEALSLKEELDFEIMKEGRLRSVKEIITDVAPQRKEIDSYFVNKDSIVGFIKTIEDLGSLSGVSLEVDSVGVDGLEIGDGVDSKILEKLNLDFTTTGSWQDTFYLIILLESLPYKVSFEEFVLEEKVDSNSKRYWDSVFSLSVVKLK